MATTLKNDISSKVIDANLYSEVATLPNMTGPNPGEIIENAAQFAYHYWQVKIVGAAGTIALRPEASLDGDGFATMAADGNDLEYDADGVYLITTTRGIRAKEVRLEWVSGAATRIEVKYRGGN